MARTAVNLNALFFISICYFSYVVSSSDDLENLDTLNFDRFVSENRFVLVLFKASTECPSCNKATEYFQQIPQPDFIKTEIHKRYVTDEGIATRLGIAEYPAIVFFRTGYPALYKDKLRSVDDIPEIAEWLMIASQIATQELYDDSFEHLTQAASGATTGDWFVLFYTGDCGKCMEAFPSFEGAAINLKYKMNFAKVDGQMNKKLVERFKIKVFPSAILFKQGKMYPYEPAKFDVTSLTAFVETWYKNVKATPVPKEPTAFDILTESIALYIKEQVESRNMVFFVSAGFVSVTLTGLIIFLLRRPESRHKSD